MDKSEDILPSLSFLATLCSSSQSVFDVLVLLSKFALYQTNTLSFHKEEGSEIINKFYGFSLPQAVINKIIKKLTLDGFCQKGKVKYSTHWDDKDNFKNLEKNFQETTTLYDEMISTIIDYAKRARLIKHIDNELLHQSFYDFIAGRYSNEENEYSTLINLFLIENGEQLDITRNLQFIKKGLVLYTGVCSSPNLDKKQWDKSLCLFFATDVLFSIYGLNGEQQKRIVFDCINLINEINSTNNIIKCFILPETVEDVENFFYKAEQIVERKETLDPTRSGMSELVKNCKSIEELLLKKVDFNNKLKEIGIEEYHEHFDITPEYYISTRELTQSVISNYKKNIDEMELVESFSPLEKINYLRQGKNYGSFEDGKYFYVTNKNLIYLIANTHANQLGENIYLSTTVNFLTEKFWLALNKGFSTSELPLSFDMVAKAKAALSAELSEQMIIKFSELEKKYNAGIISDKQLKDLYYELIDRSQRYKPENISADDITSILDFFEEEDYEKFLGEKTVLTQELNEKSNQLEKTTRDNEALKKQLDTESMTLSQLRLKSIQDQKIFQKLYDEDIALWEKTHSIKLKVKIGLIYCIQLLLFCFLMFLVFCFLEHLNQELGNAIKACISALFACGIDMGLFRNYWRNTKQKHYQKYNEQASAYRTEVQQKYHIGNSNTE